MKSALLSTGLLAALCAVMPTATLVAEPCVSPLSGVIVGAEPHEYQVECSPAYGASALADGDARTFTATTASIVIGNGVRTGVAGYRLETWDASSGLWIPGETRLGAFSYAHQQRGTSGTRLIWLWTNEVKTVVRSATAGEKVSVDGGSWCDVTNVWMRVGTEHAIRGSGHADRIHVWSGLPQGTEWNDQVTHWMAYVTPIEPGEITVSVKSVTAKDWIGGVSDCWDDAANWAPVGVPGPEHDVLIADGATVVVSNAVNIASLSLKGTADAETRLVFATKNATNRVARSVLLDDHTVMTHAKNGCVPPMTPPEVWYRLDLAVGGDMTIASGAKIDVSAAGYGPGWSPDGRDITASSSVTGRGAIPVHAGSASCGYYYHAGSAKFQEAFANPSEKAVYGSVRRPIALGSGCLHDMGGGGAVHLMVSGELNIEGAVLSRSGVQSRRPQEGGGAGGSIWLEAAKVTGAGVVDVRGGDVGGSDKYAPNASAGRLAIYQTVATSNPSKLTLKAGSPENVEGTRMANGANGSIYLENAGDTPGRGELIVDYGDNRCFNLLNGTTCTNVNCLLLTGASLDGETAFRQITVRNGGILTVPAGVTVTTDYLMDEHAQAETNGYAIYANTKGYVPTEGAHYSASGCGTIDIVKGTLSRSTDPDPTPERPVDPDPTPVADVSMPRGVTTVTRNSLEGSIVHALEVAALEGKTFDTTSVTNNWFSYPATETLATALEQGLVTYSGCGATLPDGATCIWCFADVVDRNGFVARTEPVFVTKLPVVKLTVDSEPTIQKESHTGTLEVVGNGVYGDMPAANLADIHVRGNITCRSNWSKLPYKLKLESKTNMFGMGTQKHWVLLANFFDPSQLNNKLAFDLARAAGCLAMDSVWVEVFMNGKYKGVYQFCEHIRIDKNRVNIHDWEDDASAVVKAIVKSNSTLRSEMEDLLCSDWSWLSSRQFVCGGNTYRLDDYPKLPQTYDLSGGYLFLFDYYTADSDETTLKLNTYGKYLTMANTIVTQPKYLSTNTAMCETVKGELEAYFQAIQSPDGYFNGRHYTEMSDIDTMVAYWIVQSFTCNVDAILCSIYAYKDQGGKLKWGPAWDYSENAYLGCHLGSWTLVHDEDSGVDRVEHYRLRSYWRNYQAGTKDGVTNPYPFWADDPYFCLKLWEKWQYLKSYFAELMREGGSLDRDIEYLWDSGEVNQAAFTCNYNDQKNGAWKYDSRTDKYEKLSYAELTWGVREFIRLRLQNWDADFASVDALERAFNACWRLAVDTRAQHPSFVADTENYHFTVRGRFVERAGAAFAGHTDVFVASGDAVRGSVYACPANVQSVVVFVNGLSNGVYAVKHGTADIAVPAEQLTNPKGSRNMIQFIGLDENGARLGQSYALVELADGPESVNPSDPSHVHALGPWTTNRVATCLESGERTRVCLATGCEEPPYAETRLIAALGHDWGAWYTNVVPTVESAGELRRDCRRTDCAAHETQALAAVDPVVSPDQPIPYGPIAVNIGITRGPFSVASAPVLTNVISWANAYGKKIADLESMAFSSMRIDEMAYLFNVAPTRASVDAALAAFRFKAITPGEIPSVELLATPNGVFELQGASELTGEGTVWTSPAMPFHRFFRAVLKFRANESTEAKTFMNVCYSADQKLDIWVPSSETKVPCLLYIHGGAWSSGSKADADADAYRQMFLENGWAYVAIDYRLAEAGKNPFPAQIVDCKEAVRFVRRNASALMIDTERIFVAGASAGGHLASLLGVTSGVDFFSGPMPEDDPDSRVSGVVDLFGPSDFKAFVAEVAVAYEGELSMHPKAGLLAAFFGTTDFEEMAAMFDYASPTTYITRERASLIPPFCILHSKGDPTVPYSQSTLLQSRLQAVGVPVELHAYDLNAHAVPKEAFAEIFSFLGPLTH